MTTIMTTVEAIKEAQETGKIAITKETANMLMAIAKLNEAHEEVITAIEENCPAEMNDAKILNPLEEEIYESWTKTQNAVFNVVGKMILKQMFIFRNKNYFKGI